MAVIDEETKQQAKELWLQGKKYREISEITGIKESSIKSLASRTWKKEKLQPNKKKVATLVADADKDKGPPETELLPEEIETLNNEELTEKQRLFCLYYVRWFNATKAYQKAYSCDYFTAAANGPRLLGNARIKEEIQRIKDAKIKQTMYSTEDYFQKMIDIAYSDVTDYLSFGQEEAQDKNGNTFMMNVINLKESCDVDGTLIQEVKQGKDGIAVKLVSKEFALKWMDKHYSEATDLQKAQIEQLRAQTDKLKADNENAPDDSTQCAMDAITGIVEQMQPLKDDDV
jgi:phage terminase small subunit